MDGNPYHSCLENPMGRVAGGLQPIGLQRVRHDWSNLAHMHAHCGFLKKICSTNSSRSSSSFT